MNKPQFLASQGQTDKFREIETLASKLLHGLAELEQEEVLEASYAIIQDPNKHTLLLQRNLQSSKSYKLKVKAE